jgi:imidazole glycerol-phosphate synthase subunit HisH
MSAAPAPTITIVDYGVVNLGSIRNMLRKLGFNVELAADPQAIARAEKVILPGIGAFDPGVSALAERGLIEPLRERAAAGVPFLGICLGMQLLGRGSEEGVRGGLNLIPGHSIRFQLPPGSNLKIPHMGWNEPTIKRTIPLVAALDARARFYFTHSYHFVCDDPADVVATCNHGIEFTVMIQRGNVMGAQFHPEKSHRFGMAVLRSFGAV